MTTDMQYNASSNGTSNDSKGIVYVLTNPAMPSLLKIGRTARKDMGERLRDLFTTGVPSPFVCEFAGYVDDHKKVESAFHKAFAPYRYTPRREFFSIKPEKASINAKSSTRRKCVTTVKTIL